MLDFNKELSKTKDDVLLHEMRLRYNLALSNLEVAKCDMSKANLCIYVAFTHLAKIDELNIDMNAVDHLQFTKGDSDVDYDCYRVALNKCSELSNLIAKKEVEVGNAIINRSC